MTIRDLQGRLFQPGFIADIPSGNLVWVDPVNGNDDLAVRGRMTVPFKTLTKAKTAAVSGDTIIVLPGTYNENNLLKNGVNWYFMPGAKVSYSGAGAAGIFDTSANGSNGAVSSLIAGYGEFIITATTSTAHVVHASGTGSNLVVQGRRMDSSTVPTVKLAQSSSGSCHVDMIEDINCTSGDVIVFATSVTGNTIRARDFITSGGRCLYGNTGSGGLDLTARNLRASADSAVSLQGGTGPVTISAQELYSQSKPAVVYDLGSTGGILTIKGARLVSQASVAADGRALQINSASSSHKVKLASCVLIASSAAAESIYSGSANTVHILGGGAANKNKHANIALVGSSVFVVDSNYV